MDSIYSHFVKFGEIEFVRPVDASLSIVAFACLEAAVVAANSTDQIGGVSAVVSFERSGHVAMDGGLVREKNRPMLHKCSICTDGARCAISFSGFPGINPRGVTSDHLVVASMIRRELLSLLQSQGKVESIKLYVDKPGVLKCVTSFNRCIDAASFLERSPVKLFGNVLSLQQCRVDDFENGEELGDSVDESIMEASRTLYISNIHEKTSHDDLWDYFGKYGHIITVDSNRMPLFAFIQYSNISSVVRAVSAGRTDYMWGRKLKLNFGKTLRWKILWIKINGVFVRDDVISHIKRLSRPEKFDIDNANAEMLVTYRRADDAAYAVKRLKGNQAENGFFIMVDYSSDKMDKYFVRRHNIETVWERRGVESNKMSDILPKHHDMDSSSICSFDSNGGRSRGNESIKQEITSMDKLVVVDSSCHYNSMEEKALELINMIHPHMESSLESRQECSSVLMSHVVSCLRLSDPPRPPSPSLDVTFDNNVVKQHPPKPEEMESNNPIECTKEEFSGVKNMCSDSLSVSEESCPDKKSILREKTSGDHSVEFFDDLFVPDNLMTTEAKGKGVKDMTEMNGDGTVDAINGSLSAESKPEKVENMWDVFKVESNGKCQTDEEFSPPKRQRKRVSHVCIESDDEHAMVDVYSDIVANAAKEVGISMYDSIKIRRIYNSNTPQVDETSSTTTRKRKYSSDSAHSSGRKKKSAKQVKPESTVWSTDLLLSASEHESSEKEVEDVKMDTKEHVEKTALNGFASKKRKTSKVKISTGLSRILKNNVKFLRNRDAYKPIPTKDFESVVKKEEVVESNDNPSLPVEEKSDSDSTITVVHSDERVCSPVVEELPQSPDPPVLPVETSCNQVVKDDVPSTSVVYSQSYVYSNMPINYDIQQVYYQPSIYLSPIEMMRPSGRFVNPNSFVYSNDSFALAQQGNYCLQPIQQYMSTQNMPIDCSLIPSNFGQVQYIRPQQQYVQRINKDMAHPLCSTVQGVRIQQPYLVASPNIVCAPVQPIKDGQQFAAVNTFLPPGYRPAVVTPEKTCIEQPRSKSVDQPLRGCLMMKKVSVQVDYHYITGSYSLAQRIMPIEGTAVADLQMTQRMHLIKSQIDEVEKRLKIADKWCSFVVTPHKEENNLTIFRKNFVEYLSVKNVAGIVSYNSSKERTDDLFPVIYFIPPGDLSLTLLARWTTEENQFRGESDLFLAIVSGK